MDYSEGSSFLRVFYDTFIFVKHYSISTIWKQNNSPEVTPDMKVYLTMTSTTGLD